MTDDETTGYPDSNTGAIAVFNSTAKVKLNTSANTLVSKITLNADVTFIGDARTHSLNVQTVDGSGMFIATNGVQFIVGSSYGKFNLTFDANLKIEPGDHYSQFYSYDGYDMILNGNLSGEGTFYCNDKSNGGAVNFCGNNSGFKGLFFYLSTYTHRCNVNFLNDAASSALARWHFHGYEQKSSNFVDGNTYHFGSLESSKLHMDGGTNITLVVGGIDYDSSILGNMGSSFSGCNKLVKVGDRKLTFSASCLSNLTIKAGIVQFAGNSLPHDVTIEGGAIVLNEYFTPEHLANLATVTAAEEFALQVELSNHETVNQDFAGLQCGFVKKGAGTLEFSVAPAWAGQTRVEDGLLIVPSTTTLNLDDATTASVTAGSKIYIFNKSSAKVWIGGEKPSDGVYNWSESANWYGGNVPTSATDVVIIPGGGDELKIKLGANNSYGHTGILNILRNVTFSGYGYIDNVSGTGTLTLDGLTIGSWTSGNGEYSYVYCDLCVKNSISLAQTKYITRQLYCYGAFSGDGKVECNGNGCAFIFYGDTSQFSGYYYQHRGGDYDRDGTAFYGDATGSDNATWNLNRSGSYQGLKVSDEATVHFGCLTNKFFSLSKSSYNNAASGWYKNVMLIVGGKAGTDSLIEGMNGTLKDASSDTGSNILRKIGPTSSLSIKLSETGGTIEAEGGTTYIVGDYLPKYLKLTGKDAVVYVVSTLDASSLVESSLAAYTVEKSTETETIDAIEYYKFTLSENTASAIANDGTTYYATIAEAIEKAADGATIAVTGEGGEIVIPAGRTLTFVTSGEGSITSVTGADSVSVTADSEGKYTYSCPRLFVAASTGNETCEGTITIDGDYYSGEIFIPRETIGAAATLNIGEESTLRGTANIRVASKNSTAGRINVTRGGALTHDTAGSIMLGGATDARGVLNIAGGSVTNAFSDVNVGYNSGGYGAIDISSGTFDLTAGCLLIGSASGGTGCFTVSGGTTTISAAKGLRIGHKGTGTMIMTGGKVNTTSESRIGSDAASNGSLEITGGEMSVSGDFFVADNATATASMTISDKGKFTAIADLKIANGPNSSATATFSGGETTVRAVNIGNGNASNGSVTISGGTFTTTGDNGVKLAANSTSATGTLTLSGGTLATKKIQIGNSSNTATLNFNGGVLAPTAANQSDFIAAGIAKVIQAGGMIVSNDVAVTIDMTGFEKGDGVTTPALTKKGTGVLTLANVPAELGLEINVEENSDSVKVPTGATYTPGGTTKVGSTDGGYDVLVYGTGVTIDAAEFTYYANYESAKTVVATVTGTVLDGTTFTLTAGGQNYTGVYDSNAGTVTFSNVGSNLGIGDEISYSIAASGASTGSLGETTAQVGAVTDDWMLEDATHVNNHGQWTNSSDVDVTLEYTDGKATLNDATFTPESASDGKIVTITTVVQFNDVANDVVSVSDVQAALKIADENGLVFKALTANSPETWSTAYGVTPDEDVMYTVVIKIDYTLGKYSINVNETQLTTADGGSGIWFDLADSSATSVSSIEYKGSCVFTSLAGSYVGAESITETVDAGTVKIDSDWVAANMGTMTISEARAALAPNATETAGNGYNYFANYALGLDPEDETDVPVVDIRTAEGGTLVATLKNKDGEPLGVAGNVSVTLTMKSGTAPGELTTATSATEGDGENASFTIAPGADSVRYHKIQVDIGAK